MLAGLGPAFTAGLVATAGSDLVFLAGELGLLVARPLVQLRGFLLNAVVEKLFYRVWLQTSLEHLLGRWPEIGMASLLWASWHVAIQGKVARYRVQWPLLVVHGAVNTPLATSMWVVMPRSRVRVTVAATSNFASAPWGHLLEAIEAKPPILTLICLAASGD